HAAVADLEPAAQRRARRAAEESSALRARAADAVDDLRELRARVVELRSRLARERLALTEDLDALGGALTAERLLPLARAAGARLTGVRTDANAASRMSAEGALAALARLAALVGASAGVEVRSLAVAGG